MLNFFRRKSAGKREDARADDGNGRARADKNSARVSHAKVQSEHSTIQKDVVNLLIPPTEYAQKTGLPSILHNIMAGKRRNKKKKKNQNISRAESFKEISKAPEEKAVNLYRSHSQSYKDEVCLSSPASESDLTYDVIDPPDAAFVRELVLGKYKNKPQRQHVSLVYVSSEPERARLEEKQHAELLLRELARRIDCDFDEHMGAADSKSDGRKREKHEKDEMAVIKDDLRSELHKLLNDNAKVNESAVTNVIVTEDNVDSENETNCENNKQANDYYHDVDNIQVANREDYCDVDNEVSSVSDYDCIDGHLESKNECGMTEIKYEENYETPTDQNGFVPTVITEFNNGNDAHVRNYKETEIYVTHTDSVDDRDSGDDETTRAHEFKSAESSPSFPKKSNLKPPRSDTEACSDDERSDGGTKRVTFRKTIEFDDGDEQTDVEMDSSFGSLTSSEDEDDDGVEVEEIEEIEEEEDEGSDVPDNNELLGGVIVQRTDEVKQPSDNKTSVIISEPDDVKHCDAESIDKLKQFNTVIIREHIEEPVETVEVEIKEGVKCESDRIGSDNSDSGFCERAELVESESETEEVTDDEEVTEEEVSEEEEVTEEEEDEETDPVVCVVEPDSDEDLKNLVSQEDELSAQVARLNTLASERTGETGKMADVILSYRKDIETKHHEIERLKSEVGAAYKECELIRQRSRSLEEELAAARSCSANLADRLSNFNDETERSLRAQLQAAHARIAELEARLAALEGEQSRLVAETLLEQQKAAEAVSAAEASSARWKMAHEAARSQAAATAERLLADCEWKMRELERRARDAEKASRELTGALEKTKAEAASASSQAELQQLRGLLSEQQRSVQALSSQLLRVEAREDTLKTEVHRLKQLLDKEAQIQRDKDEKHLQALSRLEATHARRLESQRAELQSQHAASRAAAERAHADKTRAALAQLRQEHERETRAHERRMREHNNKYESLQRTLEEKRSEHEQALAEAHSRADWELLQLRHLLDKADIGHARALEAMTEKHETECERLNTEWAERLRLAEEGAAKAATDAQVLLDTTRSRMEAERMEQLNRLKDMHRKEMDEQWENFMHDKESCLARMKLECRQEGEEERVKREKDLLEEIADLKMQLSSKDIQYDDLENKSAACGRTLAVTEQELREALEREKELRSLRSEDAEKLRLARNASKNEVEHLQRKCACVRKLFDDMRARLAAREKTSAEESRTQQREIQLLKNEIARLTKLLMQSSTPQSQLGARTRADGCDSAVEAEPFLSETAPPACDTPTTPPRRKGGTLRTPELARKRPNFEPLKPLDLPDLKPVKFEDSTGRRRAKSVDLPAVQVPGRIKQLEERGIKK